MENEPDDLLTRKKAAHFLLTHGYPVTAKTLRNWASNQNSGAVSRGAKQGGGPPFYRAQRRVVYRTSDLVLWLSYRIKRVEACSSIPQSQP